MNHSDELHELAAALSKAQAAMPDAIRSGTNPHFRADYATLGSVWDACRQPLAANGLSVVQVPEASEPGCVALTTLLLHESGQWISGTLSMPVTKPDAQGYGSAITYCRRYGIAALVGVCPQDEDDDGNAASAPREQLRQTLRQPDGRKFAVVDHPESRGDQQAAEPPSGAREALIGEVHTRFKDLHAGEKFYPWASVVLGRTVAVITDLLLPDLDAVNEHLCAEGAALEAAPLEVEPAAPLSALRQGA